MKKNRQTMKPKYEPQQWKKFRNAGCYPYCLDLKVDKFFLVGDLIGKRCDSHVTNMYLIQTLKEELETIFDYKVKEVDTEYRTKKGEKKIYLQRDEHTGYYHFLREDDDNVWSHKFPNELPVRVDSIGNIIEDPDSMVESAFSGYCFLLKRESR